MFLLWHHVRDLKAPRHLITSTEPFSWQSPPPPPFQLLNLSFYEDHSIISSLLLRRQKKQAALSLAHTTLLNRQMILWQNPLLALHSRLAVWRMRRWHGKQTKRVLGKIKTLVKKCSLMRGKDASIEQRVGGSKKRGRQLSLMERYSSITLIYTRITKIKSLEETFNDFRPFIMSRIWINCVGKTFTC